MAKMGLDPPSKLLGKAIGYDDGLPASHPRWRGKRFIAKTDDSRRYIPTTTAKRDTNQPPTLFGSSVPRNFRIAGD